jgi:hypothetical integral membrane protein (TIGR02206 family)
MWTRETFVDWEKMASFSPQHWVCLAALVVGSIVLPLLAKNHFSARANRLIAMTLAWVSASGYLLWLVAVLWFDAFNLTRDLPLEFCYLVGILAPAAIAGRSQVLFDFFYYGAFSGVFHACVTPIFAPHFPHPRFWAFWALHGGVVLTAVFAVVVLGRRPTYLGIFTTVGLLACILLVVIPVNALADANYFYLRQVPPGSIQESLGPWPWFVSATLVIGLVNFHLAFLPFVNWRSGKQPIGEP